MTAPHRPAGWLPDPLDPALVRYWDGLRWTFHTAVRRVEQAPPPPQPTPPPVVALRPDIAQAADRVRGLLVGAKKEINLLEGHLEPEERVLALTGAVGEGTGVLVCTDRRLLFLFVGLLRRQFLQVRWNQAREVVYDRSTKLFAVYTVRRTKRAVPALEVTVHGRADAEAVAHAAASAASAPRLDVL
ncbi:DUF2510 domain-containing protein [Actinosynnema mirum]|uniref:DUF2510 domain-containing protein n=1 Tax=Actinosynnema mirum (strain ATCC 29888 / DSM 43827 / JCM 3225 / NBRC 14064 / NCIMB 13271 / NRRL B-12336 / IMRU 3971 / 101) TaxID=446462 RepID=C6WL27_ACTMD|nr:DUF2510 domain-containing protein [Actinosynnema mirum]ACU36380.1 hypothetical protein Amir_2440 [Actinosynnema mirum DSM 43827]